MLREVCWSVGGGVGSVEEGVGKCVGVWGEMWEVEKHKSRCGRKYVGVPHASPTPPFTSPTPQHTFPTSQDPHISPYLPHIPTHLRSPTLSHTSPPHPNTLPYTFPHISLYLLHTLFHTSPTFLHISLHLPHTPTHSTSYTHPIHHPTFQKNHVKVLLHSFQTRKICRYNCTYAQWRTHGGVTTEKNENLSF